MSAGPNDDQRRDEDHTDELPVLLETVVLDQDVFSFSATDDLDETGEHTAHPAAESASVEGLKSALAVRGAKIEALETDIAKLSARWADIEQHLTAKDLLIEDLQQTLTSLRESLEKRGATDRHLAGEVTGRDLELRRVQDELEAQRLAVANGSAEIQKLRETAQAAHDEAAALREKVTAHAAVSRPANETQILREEIATLAAYIDNRRTHWNELETQAKTSAARVDAVEQQLADRSKQQQRAETLAGQEKARATALRADLVEQARLVETLRRELAATRTSQAERPSVPAGLVTELASAHAANAQTATELAATRAALAAALTERDTAQEAARANNADEGRGARVQPGDAAAPPVPEPAFEVIAQLEVQVAHKRQQVSAQLAELHDRDQRLTVAQQQLASSQLALGTARTELEQARADSARLERALVDKDRALEARDTRVATLQEELNQRLGALPKLNAMDTPLQGLDSKMSARLRRTDSPATDRTHAPALVCLTGDAPKQVALTRKAIIIGRGAECDVQILTPFVSREHARITLIRGNAIIEDIGSTNGVFVNSVRVDRHELRQGDLITVGETQFRFLESMAH